ncbi:sodium/proton-translocating pyrophosphatase [Candidatus Bathyarchaeota archaeon]|nr:sodium/proton-translocating pyrophosphatase [Candidatus Bathyarchaeota archaeon]
MSGAFLIFISTCLMTFFLGIGLLRTRGNVQIDGGAVIGDTVGDPFKDAAGPSLDTLVTVISGIASLFAPLIIAYALIGV